MNVGDISLKVFSHFSKLKKLSFYDCSYNMSHFCELLKVCVGLEELSFQTYVYGYFYNSTQQTFSIFQDIVKILKSRPTNITLNFKFYKMVVSRKSYIKKKGTHLSSKPEENFELKMAFEITYMVNNLVQEINDNQIEQSRIYKTLDENNFEAKLYDELEDFITSEFQEEQ